MNLTPAVTLALAILTVIGAVAAIGMLALVILGVVWAPARSGYVRLLLGLSADGVRLAWLVAFVATSGSLYFSQVAGYEPCRLCWYQRIAMYPLVAVIGMGALRGDTGVVRYALPLTAIGAPISLYHYLIEWVPSLAGTACDPRNPCTLVWFRELGFVSLPFMALTGFVLVGILLVLADRGRSIRFDDGQTT